MKAIRFTPLATACLLLAAGTLAQAAKAESFSLVEPVVGYWRGTVTRLSACTDGVPVFSFPVGSLVNHGGTVQTTDYLPVPTDSGQGMGYWKREGHRKYFIKFTFVKWNPDGSVAGFQRVTKHSTMPDKNTQLGDIVTEALDVDGNVVDSACAVETLTRWQ